MPIETEIKKDVVHEDDILNFLRIANEGKITAPNNKSRQFVTQHGKIKIIPPVEFATRGCE